MRGYPKFSFWISIAPDHDMIYLSHIVIIWEKILPISGHRPKKVFNGHEIGVFTYPPYPLSLRRAGRREPWERGTRL